MHLHARISPPGPRVDLAIQAGRRALATHVAKARALATRVVCLFLFTVHVIYTEATRVRLTHALETRVLCLFFSRSCYFLKQHVFGNMCLSNTWTKSG